MNHGTRLASPDFLVETLDIDEEVLDSALMDLLTSDWQTLEGADALDLEVPDPLPAQLPPTPQSRR
jgi:hypothetical protein